MPYQYGACVHYLVVPNQFLQRGKILLLSCCKSESSTSAGCSGGSTMFYVWRIRFPDHSLCCSTFKPDHNGLYSRKLLE
ncbi:hypothetical protein L1987_36154 [Smallanthus sonchifolius]|uniref:Uncharacterized protein n=1 Tax=Smallanthus sonchifolius TaxID=185202 RepID=A0ACB9HEG2_9ASTR|nr:hypothetical protein L1987_36154 [Smallanthus sonchifolius]